MTTDVLYRYDIRYTNYDDGGTELVLREYIVLEETDKTYLISVNAWTKKRIRKSSYNAWAHAQKSKALDHFIRRTNKRISWYGFWLRECKTALDLAKDTEALDGKV
jgi:hypothetical protein